MYLTNSLYMACLWGCRRLCRNSIKPDSLTIYSPQKYLKVEDVGWFHSCIQCGILTSNELSYMILIRRDYEQITINCCRVCRNKLSNKWIHSINEIRFTPHKIIRIARLTRLR